MGNFITQAGSDFWDILRKKLPESFGMQWGVPDVPDMAKPVNLARSAINAYASLPTASNEDISKGVQGQVARSGLIPRPENDPSWWQTPKPTNPVESVAQSATASPALNPVGTQARAAMTPPAAPAVSLAAAPKSTEDYLRDFAKKNPGVQVNLNNQSVNDPFAQAGERGPFRERSAVELGSTAMDSSDLMPVLRRAVNEFGQTGKGLETLRNAVGRPDLSGGVMTSTDSPAGPQAGKENLLMASFGPGVRVRERFEPRDTDGEQIGEVREKLLGMLDRFQSERGRSKGFRTVNEDDIKLMSESLARLESGYTGRKQLDVTARGQDINAQSHKESLAPVLARENLNALKAPGEMALTAAQTRKFQEPSTIQGYSGAEHITMERNRDTGKWDTVTKGEGPRTNQEEGSLLKTSQGLVMEQYKTDLETVSGKNIMATPEEKKAAQDRINAVKAGIGGQKTKPTWEQWRDEIKKRGSKLSDSQLKQAYTERYGQ